MNKAKSSRERVAKFRAKKKLEALKSAGVVEDKSWEPIRVTRQWCSRNNYSIVEELETSPGISHLFLLESYDAKKYILTERRVTDKKNNEMWIVLENKEEAIGEFKSWINGNKNQSFLNVSDYENISRRILLKIAKKESLKFVRLPKTYGEVFSLYEEHVAGFEGYSSHKTFNDTTFKTQKYRARRWVSSLRNKDLPIGSERKNKRDSLLEEIVDAFQSLITSDQINKEVSLIGYIQIIRESFEFVIFQLRTQCEYFSDLSGLDAEINKILYKKLDENIKTIHNKNGVLEKGERHPFVPIDILEKMLLHAISTSRSIYFQMILELSTAVRPEEGHRLSRFAKQYLREDYTLNYRHDNLSADIPILSSKTLSEYALKERINPAVSIVSSYIIKYEKPEIPEWYLASTGHRKHNSELSPYYHRTLRTTGATMLAYCDKAQSPQKRATLRDVQARMCHKTLAMAIETYARTEPMNMPPENYFKINNYAIKYGDNTYEFHGNLWDLWLLRDVVRRMKSFLSESEYHQFLMRLVNLSEEIKRYRSNANVSEYDCVD